MPGVAQCHQLATIGQDDRLIEGTGPTQCRQPLLSTATLNPGGMRGGDVKKLNSRSYSGTMPHPKPILIVAATRSLL